MFSPWIWLIGVGAAIAAAVGLGWFALKTRRQRTRMIVAQKVLAAADGAPTLDSLIPESNYIEVDGVNVHYVQAGTGPDLVLLHGIGASLFIWRFLFPLLQTHYRVTAIDLPGFGKSSKHASRDYGLDAQTRHVRATLSALGIEKARIVGSSMGGAITLWLAKQHPELYTDVAVLSPATDPALVPKVVPLLTMGSGVFRRALNRQSMRLILGHVIHRRDVITDETVDRYLEPFLDEGDSVRAFMSATRLLCDSRLPNALNCVNCRALVIYGERDRIVPRRSIDKLMRVLPSAELSLHPEGGHHIMEDEPVWIARELFTFFGDIREPHRALSGKTQKANQKTS